MTKPAYGHILEFSLSLLSSVILITNYDYQLSLLLHTIIMINKLFFGVFFPWFFALAIPEAPMAMAGHGGACRCWMRSSRKACARSCTAVSISWASRRRSSSCGRGPKDGKSGGKLGKTGNNWRKLEEN